MKNTHTRRDDSSVGRDQPTVSVLFFFFKDDPEEENRNAWKIWWSTAAGCVGSWNRMRHRWVNRLRGRQTIFSIFWRRCLSPGFIDIWPFFWWRWWLSKRENFYYLMGVFLDHILFRISTPRASFVDFWQASVFDDSSCSRQHCLSSRLCVDYPMTTKRLREISMSVCCFMSTSINQVSVSKVWTWKIQAIRRILSLQTENRNLGKFPIHRPVSICRQAFTTRSCVNK